MTSTSTTAKRRFSFRRKAASPLADGHHKKTFWQRVYRDRYLLLLFLPCLIYYILFKYVPMWGVLISFKDFKPFIGFMGSDWVGLKHYVNFFSNPDAWRIIRNTLFLGVYSLVWCFPFPIIFALALNECCFSKRMRKVFRKNEKSMLQNCNKKAKRKGRLQRVKKPM